MKRLLVLFFVLTSAASTAHAENGDQYWFAHAGLLFDDKSEKPDALTMLGLTYGYGITEKIAMEIDYNHSLTGGGYSKTLPAPVNGNSTEDGKYSLWMLSANAVYRHLLLESLYFKGKLGFTYGKEERTSNIPQNADKQTLTSVDGGLGIGYLAGAVIGSSLTIELEYTIHKQDLMSLMLGANITF